MWNISFDAIEKRGKRASTEMDCIINIYNIDISLVLVSVYSQKQTFGHTRL